MTVLDVAPREPVARPLCLNAPASPPPRQANFLSLPAPSDDAPRPRIISSTLAPPGQLWEQEPRLGSIKRRDRDKIETSNNDAVAAQYTNGHIRGVVA
jgi:hypothetical protein